MNDPLMMLVRAARGGGNPMSLLQQMAGQNPQISQFIKMMGGKSPQQMRTMAENMARERGININDLAQRLGLR